MRARLERFFSPAIRLKRLTTPGGRTGFRVDRVTDWKLARKCDLPYFFPEADYDRWLAMAGSWGVSIEVVDAQQVATDGRT